jgi:hypothetical protein
MQPGHARGAGAGAAHQAAGDEVVIITATNEFVTRPIARPLACDELIAVELERGADGWITGDIKGVPSAREGKVTRMAQWLAARGLTGPTCTAPSIPIPSTTCRCWSKVTTRWPPTPTTACAPGPGARLAHTGPV